MKTTDDEFEGMLPPPTETDTFGNLGVKTTRKEKREPGRPRKHAKEPGKSSPPQIGLKVSAQTRDRFVALEQRHGDRNPNSQRADFVEALLDAYERGGAPAPPPAPVPPSEEKAAGRVFHVDLWVTHNFLKTITNLAQRKAWSLSETIFEISRRANDANKVAAEAAQLREQNERLRAALGLTASTVDVRQ